mgnify:CR=1 FL=1
MILKKKRSLPSRLSYKKFLKTRKHLEPKETKSDHIMENRLSNQKKVKQQEQSTARNANGVRNATMATEHGQLHIPLKNMAKRNNLAPTMMTLLTIN